MVRTTTANEPVKAQDHIKAQTLLSWALKSSDLEWFQGPSCKRVLVWVSVKKGQQSGSISPNLTNPVTLKYNDKVILFQYLRASFHRVVEDRAGKIRQPDLQNTNCKPKYNEITVGLFLLAQSLSWAAKSTLQITLLSFTSCNLFWNSPDHVQYYKLTTSLLSLLCYWSNPASLDCAFQQP